MPEVKPTDRLNFNFKGLFKKKLKVKKTNQTEEPKVTKEEPKRKKLSFKY